MKQLQLYNEGSLAFTALSADECLQIKGGSWIGDIGEAVGGALGFATGFVFRLASETARTLTGPLAGYTLR